MTVLLITILLITHTYRKEHQGHARSPRMRCATRMTSENGGSPRPHW